MSNLNNSRPPSLPPVDHYDVIYEYDVQDLAILMAHDNRDYWTPMLTVDADDTINQPKLTYLKEHIAALQEEYAELSKASKALATTGKNWMIDAAKHPAEVRGPQREKFAKMREAHDVPTLERNAKDKLTAFKDEIKKHKELYSAARKIILQRTAVHKRRKPDQPDQSKVAAEANLLGFSTEVEEVGSSPDAAPDQSDQPRVLAHARWTRMTTLATEQKGQTLARIRNYLRFMDAPSSLIEIDLHGGSYRTLRNLFGFMYQKVHPAWQMPVLSDSQDFAQYFADALLQEGYPTPLEKQHIKTPTMPHVWPHILSALEWLGSLQPIAKLGHTVQNRRTEAEVQNGPFASTNADAYTRDFISGGDDELPFSESSHYVDKNNKTSTQTNEVERAASIPEPMVPPRVDYATSYAVNVLQLSAMLSDLEEDIRSSTSMDCSATSKLEIEQVIRVLRQASDLVSATATKWMGDAAGSNRYQTEWAALQTARKDLNVVPLQRQATAMLQHLRRSCQNYDDTRSESLSYNSPQTDEFGDMNNELFSATTDEKEVLDNYKSLGFTKNTDAELLKNDIAASSTTADGRVSPPPSDPTQLLANHIFFRQPFYEKMQAFVLEYTILNVSTCLTADGQPVDPFFTQDPATPDQFTVQMRTAFVRPEHIVELRESSCAVCPSTKTPEILVGRDLRHLFEVAEEHKPLRTGFLLAQSNVGTMLVGLGRADKPADQSDLSPHRSFFIRAELDGVSIDQVLKQPLANESFVQNVVASNPLVEREPHKVLHVSERAAAQKLAGLLHQMHSLEQMGVEPPSHLNEDDAAHQRIRDSIRLVDGRYEVGLPWRISHGQLPSSEELSNNFKYAFACRQALTKTLCKENLLTEYDKIFKEHLASGIISEFAGRPSHCLSHHAVIKRSLTTTKTIPVFNGNVKPDKTSPPMNDMLHKRPVLLNTITAVLLNSRLASYVLSSDIAKAFLQVTLRSEEKRFCCFLWVRGLTRPATGDNMVTYCFNGVIFGLRPSTALLAVDTTMNCDSKLEPDYDEKMPTSDQRPTYCQDQRKRFEVNERIVLPPDGPIPMLDSHLHEDEVEKYVQVLQVFPSVCATWSQDQALRPTRHDQFQFADYVTVFCRPTFLLLEKVHSVAGSSYYPMDMCLGAGVGVHPGNGEDWHQRNNLELCLAGCLYNATQGPYPVVEVGVCGHDYAEKVVVRDENGVVQTIHGRPLQSRDVEALRQHQYPVLKKQPNIVVTRLRKVDDGYYPVVLHLRDSDDQQTDVHADAIEIMRRVGMPRDYPIRCHYWTGGRTHYDNWTSHFPNIPFGFNAGSFSHGLDPDQLDLLRTIPLDQVTLEPDAPYHGKRGTSQTIGTPAGVVRAITQFKELGNRPESLQTIAQKSMANVIRMYRPDLTVIIEKADEDNARESQTSPNDQTSRVDSNTTTMFELTSICDAGCDGPHRQCSDVFLVKGPNDEGLILSDRWTRAVTNLHVSTNLRNVRVNSFVQVVLCLWGGRLLQDRPQEMLQFFEELLGYPPDQSPGVLSRWYNRITGESAKKFRAIQASDVRLALRKRFHACSLARSWMQTSSPPFQYEFPRDQVAGASDAPEHRPPHAGSVVLDLRPVCTYDHHAGPRRPRPARTVAPGSTPDQFTADQLDSRDHGNLWTGTASPSSAEAPSSRWRRENSRSSNSPALHPSRRL